MFKNNKSDHNGAAGHVLDADTLAFAVAVDREGTNLAEVDGGSFGVVLHVLEQDVSSGASVLQNPHLEEPHQRRHVDGLRQLHGLVQTGHEEPTFADDATLGMPEVVEPVAPSLVVEVVASVNPRVRQVVEALARVWDVQGVLSLGLRHEGAGGDHGLDVVVVLRVAVDVAFDPIAGLLGLLAHRRLVSGRSLWGVVVRLLWSVVFAAWCGLSLLYCGI